MFQACNRLCDLNVNHPDLMPQDAAAYAFDVTSFATPAPPTLPYETASWGRRVLALFVDWVTSSLVASVFLGVRALPFGSLIAGVDPRPIDNLWILVVFIVQTAVFTTLGGGSFGKLVTRLRTVRASPVGNLDARPLDPLRSIARQVLVVLVVPPLIYRADRRGLHDVAAGTATVTLQTYREVFRRVG